MPHRPLLRLDAISALLTLLLLLLLALAGCSDPTGPTVPPEVPPGTFVDSRDGKEYAYRGIGRQVWMTENLDFGERVEGVALQVDASDSAAQKYCASDADSNCVAYGGLYQWHTAMALPEYCDNAVAGVDPCLIDSVHRGICPEGWHVPTRLEWQELEERVDAMTPDAIDDEGRSLKSSSGWMGVPGNGTDLVGFAGLPAGNRNGGVYYSLGTFGYWWTADEIDATFAGYRYLFGNFNLLVDGVNFKSNYGFSLRCLRDG